MQPIDKNFTPVEYDPQYILMVNQLKKYFPIKGGMVGKTVGQVKAVDGVTFNLKRGTTMGLVGESGCGKTTTGRTILRLSGEKTGGQVLFNGKEVYDLSSKEMREMRTKMQIIFQDPFSSLSPRLPVGEIIGEAVREHNLVPKAELNDYIDQVMDNCGLQPFHKDRYPHEFSGGQRAYLHRKSTCLKSGIRCLRRAGICAGRIDSGADHQPVKGAAGKIQPDLSVHLP